MLLLIQSGRILAIICTFLGGLLAYGFVLHKLGFILGVVAAILLPVTLCVAPFYEGFVDNNWLPMILLFGGTLAAGLMGLIAERWSSY